MKLVELYDTSNETCVELLSCGFDVMSYLEMVDLLAMRLGGDKEYRRAARLVREGMMDMCGESCEPRPEWFDEWWESDEINTLRWNVGNKLNEMVQKIAKVNNDQNACCYIDEGMAWDCRILDLDEVARDTIARICI